MQNWFLMMLGTCCQASVSASFCGSFQSILAKTKVDFKPRQHIEKEWMIWFATRSAMHCNADVAQHLYVAYRVHWCCEAALFFDSHWCLWKLRLTLARTFCFDHVLYTWSPFGLNIRPWSEIRCVWWQNRPPCDRLIASSQWHRSRAFGPGNPHCVAPRLGLSFALDLHLYLFGCLSPAVLGLKRTADNRLGWKGF